MEVLLRMLRKLSFLMHRRKFDKELSDEILFHRGQIERSLQTDGMPAESARYAAARQFGNATRLQEQSRETVEFRFETTLQDMRYGIRQLRKNPGFAATAILVLGLGIGATTAIFSAVNPILFKSLPYPNPDRIMSVFESKDGGARLPSFATFRAIAERSRSFEATAATKVWRPAMVGLGEPEFFWGQRVSADYFRVLGVVPALGRDFQPAEDQIHGPNVLILSNRLWRRRFGADPNIIGRAITLETSRGFDATSSYTIIGVMPAGFENVVSSTAELWAPLQYNASLPLGGAEWGHHLSMIARLKPGISKQQAAAEVDAYAMRAAINHLRTRLPGARIRAMPHNNPGFDIEVDGETAIRFVEVKGTQASMPRFFITEGERQFARANRPSYLLLVVYDIDRRSDRHRLLEHEAADIEDAFVLTPTQWVGALRDGHVPRET